MTNIKCVRPYNDDNNNLRPYKNIIYEKYKYVCLTIVVDDLLMIKKYLIFVTTIKYRWLNICGPCVICIYKSCGFVTFIEPLGYEGNYKNIFSAIVHVLLYNN